MVGEDYMHKLKLILIVLAIVVVSATSFECIAQGEVLGFNTYNRCVDDSDCSAGKICVNSQCIKEGQGSGSSISCNGGQEPVGKETSWQRT